MEKDLNKKSIGWMPAFNVYKVANNPFPEVTSNREVNKWLKELKTMQPLLNEWYKPGLNYDDSVEEYYREFQPRQEQSLMVWVVVVLATTMCIVFVITYFCHGYICGWSAYHGSPYWFTRKKKNKGGRLSDVNNYERPSEVVATTQDIHVYQEGKRLSESCGITLDNFPDNVEVVDARRLEKGEFHTENETNILEIPKQKILQVGFQMRRSLISRLSIRRKSYKSRRLRTMSHGSQQKESIAMTNASNFIEEPLPPIPNLRLKRAEAMINAHARSRKNKKSFEEVQKELLSNSFDTLYRCHSTPARHTNLISRRTLLNRTTNNQVGIQTKPSTAIRSMSLDDDHLLRAKKVKKDTIRHSKSLDILHENITINTLYEEIKDDPQVCTNTKSEDTNSNSQIKIPSMPCKKTESPSKKTGNTVKTTEYFGYVEIDTKDIKKFITNHNTNNGTMSKDITESSHYTKIEDSNSDVERTRLAKIQNRPLPKPEEGKLPKTGISDDSKKNSGYLYCRASRIVEEIGNCNDKHAKLFA